jgi:hypothetical protein
MGPLLSRELRNGCNEQLESETMEDMEMEARDFLYCLKLHCDVDAQLAAIRTFLRQHLDQNRAFDEEIARLEEHARRVTGSENEWAAEEWSDRVHRSALPSGQHASPLRCFR